MSGAVIWKAADATLAPPSGQKVECSVAHELCVFVVCVCIHLSTTFFLMRSTVNLTFSSKSEYGQKLNLSLIIYYV